MALPQDQNQRSTRVTNDPISTVVTRDSIIDSIFAPDNNANATGTRIKIPRVPETLRNKTEEYEEYYIPKVVSIGPYFFGDKRFEKAEKLKPAFTKKILKDNKETLERLYDKLEAMVHELKSFYEEETRTKFCDKVFTKMMLLDSCFILTSVLFNIEGSFKNNEIFLIYNQDLLLLENQIPFKVLNEVMNFTHRKDVIGTFEKVFQEVIFRQSPKPRLRKRLKSILPGFCTKQCLIATTLPEAPKLQSIETEPDHLLHLVHILHTRKVNDHKTDNFHDVKYNGSNFRNVSELVKLGIRFEPSDTLSFTHIVFSEGSWWGFSPTVKIPPILVDDGTRAKLLNLAAYEACSGDHDLWVSSYIALLDDLIDDPEDVKVLRKAWVLETLLGSDRDVSKMFNEIGNGLVFNQYAYLEAKKGIQKHYVSWRNKIFSQLKHEHVKSPWAIFAILGALIALFLTGVQTYYTVWSPERTCDDLCRFLKLNHHL